MNEAATADVIEGATADVVAPDDASEECNQRTTQGCPCGVLCASGVCTNGGCDPVVFVTSGSWNGTIPFGGPGGAIARGDGLCTEKAAPLGRAPVTKFYAWLSDDRQSPSTRFMKSVRPYRLPTGVIVANNFAALSADLNVAIAVTEKKEPLVGDVSVWTGTTRESTSIGGPPGGPYSERCSEWTSTAGMGGYGNADSTTTLWTLATSGPCSDLRRLYCFEQLP